MNSYSICLIFSTILCSVSVWAITIYHHTFDPTLRSSTTVRVRPVPPHWPPPFTTLPLFCWMRSLTTVIWTCTICCYYLLPTLPALPITGWNTTHRVYHTPIPPVLPVPVPLPPTPEHRFLSTRWIAVTECVVTAPPCLVWLTNTVSRFWFAVVHRVRPGGSPVAFYRWYAPLPILICSATHIPRGFDTDFVRAPPLPGLPFYRLFLPAACVYRWFAPLPPFAARRLCHLPALPRYTVIAYRYHCTVTTAALPPAGCIPFWYVDFTLNTGYVAFCCYSALLGYRWVLLRVSFWLLRSQTGAVLPAAARTRLLRFLPFDSAALPIVTCPTVYPDCFPLRWLLDTARWVRVHLILPVTAITKDSLPHIAVLTTLQKIVDYVTTTGAPRAWAGPLPPPLCGCVSDYRYRRLQLPARYYLPCCLIAIIHTCRPRFTWYRFCTPLPPPLFHGLPVNIPVPFWTRLRIYLPPLLFTVRSHTGRWTRWILGSVRCVLTCSAVRSTIPTPVFCSSFARWTDLPLVILMPLHHLRTAPTARAPPPFCYVWNSFRVIYVGWLHSWTLPFYCILFLFWYRPRSAVAYHACVTFWWFRCTLLHAAFPFVYRRYLMPCRLPDIPPFTVRAILPRSPVPPHSCRFAFACRSPAHLPPFCLLCCCCNYSHTRNAWMRVTACNVTAGWYRPRCTGYILNDYAFCCCWWCRDSTTLLFYRWCLRLTTCRCSAYHLNCLFSRFCWCNVTHRIYYDCCRLWLAFTFYLPFRRYRYTTCAFVHHMPPSTDCPRSFRLIRWFVRSARWVRCLEFANRYAGYGTPFLYTRFTGVYDTILRFLQPIRLCVAVSFVLRCSLISTLDAACSFTFPVYRWVRSCYTAVVHRLRYTCVFIRYTVSFPFSSVSF